MATQLGMGAPRRRWLRRGALLHDIGKLGVSSGILDKPGRLDAAEMAAMQHHAVLSEEFLQRLSVFRDLAPIAAPHHERLDGNGYRATKCVMRDVATFCIDRRPERTKRWV